jgi:hypothetical protein
MVDTILASVLMVGGMVWLIVAVRLEWRRNR